MTDDQLNQAIALIKSGDRTTAQKILTQLVQQEPNNDAGWMWLSTCVESIEQKRHCLKNALAIDPTNNAAGQALAHLNTLVELPSVADIVAAPSAVISTIPASLSPSQVINTRVPRSEAHAPTKPGLAWNADSDMDARTDEPRSYIDQNLMRGEQVVFRTHLHWITFMAPVIAAIVGLAFIVVFSKIEPTFGPALGLMFGVPFLLATPILILAVIIIRQTSEYAVTNKRVIIKYGFIRRHSLELLLAKVEGISVDETLVGRLFDYGTLIVRGTGGTHERFRNIAQPLEFRRQVQHQIELMAGDR